MSARNLDPIDVEDHLELPQFSQLLSDFLSVHSEFYGPDSDVEDLQRLPHLQLNLYPSAVATFYAPSDHPGITGMRRERFRAVNSWMGGGARYDTVFIRSTPAATRISTGLEVARVIALFSITLQRDLEVHTCALVHNFDICGNDVDEDMGMWIVRPRFCDSSEPSMSIIPLNQIFRAAHLIPVYDMKSIPHKFSFTDTLDHYTEFYVNKFIDQHAFELAT